MPHKSVKTILVFAILLLLMICGGCALNVDSRGSDTKTEGNSDGIAQLHVEDCKIKDENGNTVQLTGMSSHGLLWYPEYTNANAMQTLKAYGANTFRIAVYSDDAGGGYAQRKDETMRLTYMAIENALSVGLYVIVDWHVLQDSNPLTNLDSAMAFFDEIASHYSDCPNILYEICNEPNGDTTWDDIYTYAHSVIPVIRGYAPNAIIIVGTPNYSYSVEAVFEKPLDYDNVMYSFHYYAGLHDNSYYNELFERCEQEKLPVFVTEWGIDYDANGKAALSQGETFAKVLNRRGISWVAWSLSNKDEVYSVIRSDCEKLSGWTSDDLTEVGKIIFDALRK